jgi:hypothetical protein
MKKSLFLSVFILLAFSFTILGLINRPVDAQVITSTPVFDRCSADGIAQDAGTILNTQDDPSLMLYYLEVFVNTRRRECPNLTVYATPTFSPGVLSTAIPTIQPTNTPLPSLTPTVPVPSVMGTQQYVLNAANLRSCPRTSCNTITQLLAGASITTFEKVTGDSANNSTEWYRAEWNGQEVYVHSSLVTTVRPPSSSSNTTTTVTTQTNVNPISSNVSVPVAQPVIPMGATCPFTSRPTCGDMGGSCEMAKACLAAGWGNLDQNNDGIPCETICR